MSKQENQEQTDMAFDMVNLMKQYLKTAKGCTIFGEGEAAHHCAKLAFDRIKSLQAERDKYKRFWNDLIKPLEDTRVERDNMKELLNECGETLTLFAAKLGIQVEGAALKSDAESYGVHDLLTSIKEVQSVKSKGKKFLTKQS